MKRKMHVVSNTHWDREHRHGFQETRLMLADVFDKLVDIMENDPDFKYYTMDGQMVPFDDYFALKPGMKERVTRLVQEGRILAGPWYSLVDTFSVSPECVVRNLLTGHREAKRLGAEPMKFGYSVFSFGQMAQLPQLYGGFGINTIIFYKGADKDVLKKSEFIWESPDGTQALTSRLGQFHRVNFFWRFTLPVIMGADPDNASEWFSSFTNGSKLCHMIDPHYSRFATLQLERDNRVREERIRTAVEETIGCAEPDTMVKDSLLFFDGIDFSQPMADMPEALRIANEQCQDLGELSMSNPLEYEKELREKINMDELYLHKGDIRMVAVDHVHSESMGANIEILRELGKAERSLIHVAEPFAAFASVLGAAYPQEAFEMAWKYIFQVHAHDSIHGLGDPKIKRDSLYRIDQAQEITDVLSRRAIETLVSEIDTRKSEDGEIFVSVFNPTMNARSDVMELQIDLPEEEHASDWWLETMDGDRLDHWVTDQYSQNMGMIAPESRPKPVRLDIWHAQVAIPEVPAFGYRTFKLKRTPQPLPAPEPIFSSGSFPFGPIGKSPRIMDNGVVRVEVQGDGTVKLTDYETGEVYSDLLEYVDRGCRGDTWVHQAPNFDADISSVGTVAGIALTSNSNLSATITVRHIMELPMSLSSDREVRKDQLIPTELSTEITLKRGSRRVNFSLAFVNEARDHFLRVRMPTEVETESCWADAPYDVSERLFKFSDHHGVRGHELARQTMTSFVDVSDGKKRGLALLSRTAKEFGLDHNDGGKGVLELSLLRSVNGRFPIDQATFIDYQDDFAYCLGPQEFEFALLPHAGTWNDASLTKEAEAYLHPFVAAEFGKGQKAGQLPLESSSFVNVKGDGVVFSGIKRAENGTDWIVRFFNPRQEKVAAEISFLKEPKAVSKVRLDETPEEELELKTGKLSLDVPAGKIMTLAVTF